MAMSSVSLGGPAAQMMDLQKQKMQVQQENYDRLKRGARPQEIAQGKSRLAAAQAEYDLDHVSLPKPFGLSGYHRPIGIQSPMISLPQSKRPCGLFPHDLSLPSTPALRGAAIRT